MYDNCEFCLTGGRISKVRASLSDEGLRRLSGAVGHALAWAVTNHPSIMSRPIRGGEFVHSRRNAVRWLLLVERWSKDREGD